MKQFFIFLFTGLSIAVLDLIDTAFGNQISLDSICVMSAMSILYWCINCVCQIGEYAYTVKMKYENESFVLEMLATIICSILVIIFRNHISHIYNLTDMQYELLNLCLLWKGLFIIFAKIESFLYTYVELNCMNKQIIISNIIFYLTMIGLDAIVILLNGECYHLIITTGIADIITAIYLIVSSKFVKKIHRPKIHIIKELINCSKDILVNNALGRVATIIFNICASFLGTKYYALHSVGYSIATSMEAITDRCCTYQVVKLKTINSIRTKYKIYKDTFKKTFIPTIIVCYLTAIMMVYPVKGTIGIKEALIVTLMYNTQSIFIQPYENIRGFLISCEDTKSLRFGGLIGIFARFPISLISIFTSIGIYGFAFGVSIDFMARFIYWKYKASNIVKKQTDMRKNFYERRFAK